MKSLIKKLFIENWPRKVISFILAVIIWFVVGQSLTATKTLTGVAVRVINLPPDMTVEGMQSSGLMSKRTTVVLGGNKSQLEEITSNNVEITIDATGHDREWVEAITRKNLTPLSSDVTVSGINRVSAKSVIVKPTKVYKEKIPVIITQPIGEAPRGYQFLDSWPYQLYLTVSGPEDEVKKLKTRGIKLTFNLSEISRTQLDDLKASQEGTRQDVVSYYVPNHWKTVFLPQISETPLEIDDPDAKYLRIDFVRSELIPLKTPVQIGLFFPLSINTQFNPNRVDIGPSPLIDTKNGLKVIAKPLYAKGVSELFLEVVRGYLEIQVIMGRKPHNDEYEWSSQFVNQRILEDRYVAILMADTSDHEISNLQPQVREEYLRNRFRNYMNRFRLYSQDDKPFKIAITLQGNQVIIAEKNG